MMDDFLSHIAAQTSAYLKISGLITWAIGRGLFIGPQEIIPLFITATALGAPAINDPGGYNEGIARAKAKFKVHSPPIGASHLYITSKAKLTAKKK